MKKKILFFLFLFCFAFYYVLQDYLKNKQITIDNSYLKKNLSTSMNTDKKKAVTGIDRNTSIVDKNDTFQLDVHFFKEEINNKTVVNNENEKQVQENVDIHEEKPDQQIQRILSKDQFESIDDFLETAFPDLGEISKELQSELLENFPVFFQTKNLLSEKQYNELVIIRTEAEIKSTELNTLFSGLSYDEYSELEEYKILFKKNNQEYNLRILNILTKEQQVKQAKLIGQLFDIEEVRNRKEEGIYPTYIPKFNSFEKVKKINNEINSKFLIDGHLR